MLDHLRRALAERGLDTLSLSHCLLILSLILLSGVEVFEREKGNGSTVIGFDEDLCR